MPKGMMRGSRLLIALGLVAGVGCPASTTAPTTTFTVGGQATGLTGPMVLRNNGGDNLSVPSNGSFVFVTALTTGQSYSVTVFTPPTGQVCTVTNGSGTVGSSNVVGVIVNCTAAPPSTFTIGGTASGLTGAMVLRNNGANNLTVPGNGSFVFSTPLANNSAYAVTVFTPPAGQTCTVANGSGTVAGANVTNVAVTCTTSAFTVGGTAGGMTGGMVLQNNGGDNLSVPGNGSFVFATALATNSAYVVTVLTPPAGQACVVSNGSGTVAAANITNVGVNCGAGAAFLTHPRNVSIVEGRTATFGVTVSGPNPTYQWQRSTPGNPFDAMPGETNATLSVVAGSVDAPDGTRYQVLVGNAVTNPPILSNAATLTVIPLSGAATVFVQVPDIFIDPVFVTQSGPSFTATADLALGEFSGRASALSDTLVATVAYAGLQQPLVFTNNTGASVAIAGGALRARIEGTYSVPIPAAGFVAEASVGGTMIVQHGSTLAIAQAGHQTGKSPDGAVVNSFTINDQTNGASVILTHATTAGLLMELVMPAITLGPGESLVVYFSITPYSLYTGAVSDFATIPARLSLTLPPGVTLDHNGAVGLSW